MQVQEESFLRLTFQCITYFYSRIGDKNAAVSSLWNIKVNEVSQKIMKTLSTTPQ